MAKIWDHRTGKYISLSMRTDKVLVRLGEEEIELSLSSFKEVIETMEKQILPSNVGALIEWSHVKVMRIAFNRWLDTNGGKWTDNEIYNISSWTKIS